MCGLKDDLLDGLAHQEQGGEVGDGHHGAREHGGFPDEGGFGEGADADAAHEEEAVEAQVAAAAEVDERAAAEVAVGDDGGEGEEQEAEDEQELGEPADGAVAGITKGVRGELGMAQRRFALDDDAFLRDDLAFADGERPAEGCTRARYMEAFGKAVVVKDRDIGCLDASLLHLHLTLKVGQCPASCDVVVQGLGVVVQATLHDHDVDLVEGLLYAVLVAFGGHEHKAGQGTHHARGQEGLEHRGDGDLAAFLLLRGGMDDGHGPATSVVGKEAPA